MEWKQIDFKDGEIRLDPGTTKNKKGRVFPMNADLRRILEERRALGKQGSRLVFTRKGDPIVSMHKAFRAACKDAGVPAPHFWAAGLDPPRDRRWAVYIDMPTQR